ncbi:E3 ubiquitin-protein ligase ORTHRUS 2-like [Magnolia sinica]|uniref:E3 ubiquitin-protein ligase ORTHRUS 2-like n=1 Tax=Magnolia sinica TaxID=86752 RepID=UPI00265934AF|nr:E3 ubiquitin-protein ligase ORTHRUS 2-like [Magnolia sinica]
MAHASDLPCDGDGICMLCKKTPSEEEKLICSTCATPWHATCLSNPPSSLSSLPQWECPDCSTPSPSAAAGGDIRFPASAKPPQSSDLIAAIRAIETDGSLTEREKARRRQELMSGSAARTAEADGSDESKASKPKESRKNDVLGLLDVNLNCSFCIQLPERPVTTPCGHNFCLKCFQKWIEKGKRSCAKCRHPIPPKMASQPRINSTLVAAIRVAKTAKAVTSGADGKLNVYHFVHNQDRPDKAFTTERAQRAGKANACSGKIFVTVPPDHFGPILAENDPARNQGVLVGESWEDRMECRQWGVHLPHVAGIAGQSEHGAQSVALSGGYQDDEDHGEWFLYTGSGGRDLSGNKRTNKEQSFDQQFDKMNEALRVSCKKGYPVRVVRSHKEKRSSYAPETGVRYDGIYRIEKCWRKVGIQGFKVCRYLFVRCDNEPAPWTSDETGDRPRSLPDIKELKKATDITERMGSPAWDYDEENGWRWAKPPPLSRKPVATGNPEDRKRARKAIRRAQNLSVREKLLKEFSCLLCRNVMNLPLTTPCAHNFCKPCLEGAFAGQTFLRERIHGGGRTLRAQKNVMMCPSCPNDISDFLQNPQVNRELMDVIESLKQQTEEDIELGEDGINVIAEKSHLTEGDTEVGSEMPEAADEDSQIAANESKQSQTYQQKKAVMISRESDDAGSENPEMPESSDEDCQIRKAESARPTTCNPKKSETPKKAKTSNKSNEPEPENPKRADGGGSDRRTRASEKKQPVTYERKKSETLKKAKNSKKSNEPEPENPKRSDGNGRDRRTHATEKKQPVTYEKTGNGKRAVSGKKSNEADADNLELANGGNKDHNTPKSKEPVMYNWKKGKDAKKATESKKSDEPGSEDSKILDRAAAEIKQPKTYVRKRPLTRSCSAKMDEKIKPSKESGDAKKPSKSKKTQECGSEDLEMLDASDEDGPTAEIKQPKTYMRKRPLTRGFAAKMDEQKAKKSRKSTKAQEDSGGNSPLSPLLVRSDDDDDFE